jgi:hypothetical protein
LAERVFDSDEKAFLWLRLPNPEQREGNPLNALSGSLRLVLSKKRIRIDHGIAG